MPYTHIARLLFGAPASGSGKTTVVCAFLQALKQRRIRAAACKSGPDYIDPMFHTKVLGTPSRNLDLFLLGRSETGKKRARYLLTRQAAAADVTVLEGAMGYYDGVGTGSEASAYELAAATATPSVLVIDGRGSGISLGAVLKGIAQFRPDSQIKGFIVNRVKPMVYEYFKPAWEKASGLTGYGCFPDLPDCTFSSRHLGLITAGEIRDLQQLMQRLAAQAEKTLDIAGLLNLAQTSHPLSYDLPQIAAGSPVTLAVARDEAFCFYYEDSLELLRLAGARIEFFSPLHDHHLPACQGLYLGGGYPELYAAELSRNTSMRLELKEAVQQGMPCFAECGGFMYLHEYFRDAAGELLPWAGVIAGETFMTDRLQRFGYVMLEPGSDTLFCHTGERIPAHEFHYSDSTDNGQAFTARKAGNTRSWPCGIIRGNLIAGYPHIHFWGSPQQALRFLDMCRTYGKENT